MSLNLLQFFHDLLPSIPELTLATRRCKRRPEDSVLTAFPLNPQIIRRHNVDSNPRWPIRCMRCTIRWTNVEYLNMSQLRNSSCWNNWRGHSPESVPATKIRFLVQLLTNNVDNGCFLVGLLKHYSHIVHCTGEAIPLHADQSSTSKITVTLSIRVQTSQNFIVHALN